MRKNLLKLNENVQQKNADDFVIATGKNYTVKDLVNLVLKKLILNLNGKNLKMDLNTLLRQKN